MATYTSTHTSPPTCENCGRDKQATYICDACCAKLNAATRKLAAEVDELRGKLDWAQQVIKAQEETSNGTACARERAAGNGGCGACSWCCTQARAEVDARDEVITKLLELLLAGVAPPHDPCGCVECERHEINEGRYRRACEIAGRTE